jgi:hypothetical protein
MHFRSFRNNVCKFLSPPPPTHKKNWQRHQMNSTKSCWLQRYIHVHRTSWYVHIKTNVTHSRHTSCLQLNLNLNLKLSLNSTVGIATAWVWFPLRATDFILLQNIQGGGLFPQDGKTAGAWSWPLDCTSVEVKNGGNIPPRTHMFHGVALS